MQSAEDGNGNNAAGPLDGPPQLGKGADVKARGSFGDTALNLAAGRGHIGIVQLLLSKGAHVTVDNYDLK